MRRTTIQHSLQASALLLALSGSGIAQDFPLKSKRGLAYIGDDHESDTNLLLSHNSSVAWYYTWSAYPATSINTTLPFVPLIHNNDDASNEDIINVIKNLSASSTHLLTFNEPDGTTSSGGSSISPEDAAKSYINDIVPLRNSSDRPWNISHPSVTGSQQGLDWLRDFNASCYDIDADNGCPTDFIAVHWYGDFSGLSAWLGTLREFYVTNASLPESLPFWITEMALPQGDTDATVAMMNDSLPYLDGLEYVQAYAWYGAFRQGGGVNGWTGDNVALFNKGGGLTEVGALYLGGKQKGFVEGMTGGAGGIGDGAARASFMLLIITGLAVAVNIW